MRGCLFLVIIFIFFGTISGGPALLVFLPGLLPIVIIGLVWYALRGAFADQGRERQRASMGFPPAPPEERPRGSSLPSGLQLVLAVATVLAGMGLVVWGFMQL